MRQIVVIHGGTTFSKYTEYLTNLETKPIHIDRLTYRPMWKELLQQALGQSYQVLLPAMPNKTNARYGEWKAYFSNLERVLENDCILIGHSMGAIFLAKYLSENKFPHTIKATILIAAPHSDETEEDLTDFKLQSVSELFIKQAGRVIFFFGSDDPVIASTEIDMYRQEVPTAEFHVLSAPDHFVRVDFPELTRVITSL